MRVFFFILFIFTVYFAHGQEHSFLQVSWANDFTVKKDRYESNLIRAGYFHYGRSITRYLLPGIGPSYFGYGIKHGIYTPWRKRWTSFLPDDHPYAGVLAIEISRLSLSQDRKWMINSMLSAGVLGPASGAEFLQNGIHAMLPAISVPKGWDNQISNEAVFSYNIEVTRRAFKTQTVEGSVVLGGLLGSPRTALYPGFLIRMGQISDNYYGRVPVRNERIIAFLEFGSSVQMTRFNRFHKATSIETEPVFIAGHVAGNVSYKSWMMRIGQSFNTPQFEGASWHGLGSVDFYFTL